MHSSGRCSKLMRYCRRELRPGEGTATTSVGAWMETCQATRFRLALPSLPGSRAISCSATARAARSRSHRWPAGRTSSIPSPYLGSLNLAAISCSQTARDAFIVSHFAYSKNTPMTSSGFASGCCKPTSRSNKSLIFLRCRKARSFVTSNSFKSYVVTLQDFQYHDDSS